MSIPESNKAARKDVPELVGEIEALAQSALPEPAFFAGFLEKLLAAFEAPAGAVWLLNDGRGLELNCHCRLQENGILATPQAKTANDRLLSDVLSTGEACYRFPGEQPLPSDHPVLLAALQNGSNPVGVVQVFQRPTAQKQLSANYVQFIEQMAGYASHYLSRRRNAASKTPDEFWREFEQLSLRLSRSRTVSEVAATAVNDCRLLLECNQVSLAIKRGKKVSIAAISGSDTVNRRANLVQAMRALAKTAVQVNESQFFNGELANLSPQIEKPLANYIALSHSRLVMVAPLLEPERIARRNEEEDGAKKGKRRPRVIGALIVEQMSRADASPEWQERVDMLAEHVAAALHQAQAADRVFLLPLWRLLGGITEWFHGRKLLKLMGTVALLAAIGTALAVVPWEYRVEGEGRLMPVEQRQVFAPWDGVVVDIFVEDGDRVAAGDKLLLLRNDDLRAEVLVARNELVEKQQLIVALQAQIDDAIKAANRDEETRLEGKLVETQIEVEGVGEQLQILEDRERLLTVAAPIAGEIATFRLDQLLKNRPVRRGEALVEVMNVDGTWQLELEVEEERIGHVLRAQQREGGDKLPVEFVLATSSETSFRGTLESMATRSATSKDRGSVMEVIVATDVEKLPDPRIGAEVRAKIDCGKRALGYVLFGDVIEFLRRQLWL